MCRPLALGEDFECAVACQESRPAREVVHIGQRNADVDDADCASLVNPCTDIEPEFWEAQRDGQRSADRLPEDGAAVGMETGWEIDGDDGFSGSVDELDGFTIGPGYAIKPFG